FDETVRAADPGLCVVARVVILRVAGGFDLLQGHAPFNRGLHAVANDRDHVAVLDYVKLIADAAVPGNDVRSALFLVLGNGNVDDAVESVNFALNAAAVIDIDEGKTGGDE